jgi:hypothetical protein
MLKFALYIHSMLVDIQQQRMGMQGAAVLTDQSMFIQVMLRAGG